MASRGSAPDSPLGLPELRPGSERTGRLDERDRAGGGPPLTSATFSNCINVLTMSRPLASPMRCAVAEHRDVPLTSLAEELGVEGRSVMTNAIQERRRSGHGRQR